MGSHLSPHILTDLPSPILQIRHWNKRSLALHKLFQAKDGFDHNGASRNEQFGKYLTFRICAAIEFGSCKILHPCLARRALLNTTKSRKPSPQ